MDFPGVDWRARDATSTPNHHRQHTAQAQNNRLTFGRVKALPTCRRDTCPSRCKGVDSGAKNYNVPTEVITSQPRPRRNKSDA